MNVTRHGFRNIFAHSSTGKLTEISGEYILTNKLLIPFYKEQKVNLCMSLLFSDIKIQI
jgi:hypothetical protein